MKELEQRLNELMVKASDMTGEDFTDPEEAIDFLKEQEDDDSLELAEEIDTVLCEMDDFDTDDFIEDEDDEL